MPTFDRFTGEVIPETPIQTGQSVVPPMGYTGEPVSTLPTPTKNPLMSFLNAFWAKAPEYIAGAQFSGMHEFLPEGSALGDKLYAFGERIDQSTSQELKDQVAATSSIPWFEDDGSPVYDPRSWSPDRLPDVANKIMSMWGENMPMMVRSMADSYIGRKVIGATAGLGIGLADVAPGDEVVMTAAGMIASDLIIPSFYMSLLEAHNFAKQATDAGMDADIAAKYARYYGPLAGVIEQSQQLTNIGIGKSKAGAGGRTLIDLKKKGLQALFGKLMGKIDNAMPEMAKEGFEETTQDGLSNKFMLQAQAEMKQRYGEGWTPTQPINERTWSDSVESFAGGAVIAGMMKVSNMTSRFVQGKVSEENATKAQISIGGLTGDTAAVAEYSTIKNKVSELNDALKTPQDKKESVTDLQNRVNMARALSGSKKNRLDALAIVSKPTEQEQIEEYARQAQVVVIPDGSSSQEIHDLLKGKNMDDFTIKQDEEGNRMYLEDTKNTLNMDSTTARRVYHAVRRNDVNFEERENFDVKFSHNEILQKHDDGTVYTPEEKKASDLEFSRILGVTMTTDKKTGELVMSKKDAAKVESTRRRLDLLHVQMEKNGTPMKLSLNFAGNLWMTRDQYSKADTSISEAKLDQLFKDKKKIRIDTLPDGSQQVRISVINSHVGMTDEAVLDASGQQAVDDTGKPLTNRQFNMRLRPSMAEDVISEEIVHAVQMYDNTKPEDPNDARVRIRPVVDAWVNRLDSLIGGAVKNLEETHKDIPTVLQQNGTRVLARDWSENPAKISSHLISQYQELIDAHNTDPVFSNRVNSWVDQIAKIKKSGDLDLDTAQAIERKLRAEQSRYGMMTPADQLLDLAKWIKRAAEPGVKGESARNELFTKAWTYLKLGNFHKVQNTDKHLVKYLAFTDKESAQLESLMREIMGTDLYEAMRSAPEVEPKMFDGSYIRSEMKDIKLSLKHEGAIMTEKEKQAFAAASQIEKLTRTIELLSEKIGKLESDIGTRLAKIEQLIATPEFQKNPEAFIKPVSQELESIAADLSANESSKPAAEDVTPATPDNTVPTAKDNSAPAEKITPTPESIDARQESLAEGDKTGRIEQIDVELNPLKAKLSNPEYVPTEDELKRSTALAEERAALVPIQEEINDLNKQLDEFSNEINDAYNDLSTPATDDVNNAPTHSIRAVEDRWMDAYEDDLDAADRADLGRGISEASDAIARVKAEMKRYSAVTNKMAEKLFSRRDAEATLAKLFKKYQKQVKDWVNLPEPPVGWQLFFDKGSDMASPEMIKMRSDIGDKWLQFFKDDMTDMEYRTFKIAALKVMKLQPTVYTMAYMRSLVKQFEIFEPVEYSFLDNSLDLTGKPKDILVNINRLNRYSIWTNQIRKRLAELTIDKASRGKLVGYFSREHRGAFLINTLHHLTGIDKDIFESTIKEDGRFLPSMTAAMVSAAKNVFAATPEERATEHFWKQIYNDLFIGSRDNQFHPNLINLVNESTDKAGRGGALYGLQHDRKQALTTLSASPLLDIIRAHAKSMGLEVSDVFKVVTGMKFGAADSDSVSWEKMTDRQRSMVLNKMRLQGFIVCPPFGDKTYGYFMKPNKGSLLHPYPVGTTDPTQAQKVERLKKILESYAAQHKRIMAEIEKSGDKIELIAMKRFIDPAKLESMLNAGIYAKPQELLLDTAITQALIAYYHLGYDADTAGETRPGFYGMFYGKFQNYIKNEIDEQGNPINLDPAKFTVQKLMKIIDNMIKRGSQIPSTGPTYSKETKILFIEKGMFKDSDAWMDGMVIHRSEFSKMFEQEMGDQFASKVVKPVWRWQDKDGNWFSIKCASFDIGIFKNQRNEMYNTIKRIFDENPEITHIADANSVKYFKKGQKWARVFEKGTMKYVPNQIAKDHIVTAPADSMFIVQNAPKTPEAVMDSLTRQLMFASQHMPNAAKRNAITFKLAELIYSKIINKVDLSKSENKDLNRLLSNDKYEVIRTYMKSGSSDGPQSVLNQEDLLPAVWSFLADRLEPKSLRVASSAVSVGADNLPDYEDNHPGVLDRPWSIGNFKFPYSEKNQRQPFLRKPKFFTTKEAAQEWIKKAQLYAYIDAYQDADPLKQQPFNTNYLVDLAELDEDGNPVFDQDGLHQMKPTAIRYLPDLDKRKPWVVPGSMLQTTRVPSDSLYSSASTCWSGHYADPDVGVAANTDSVTAGTGTDFDIDTFFGMVLITDSNGYIRLDDTSEVGLMNKRLLLLGKDYESMNIEDVQAKKGGKSDIEEIKKVVEEVVLELDRDLPESAVNRFTKMYGTPFPPVNSKAFIDHMNDVYTVAPSILGVFAKHNSSVDVEYIVGSLMPPISLTYQVNENGKMVAKKITASMSKAQSDAIKADAKKRLSLKMVIGRALINITVDDAKNPMIYKLMTRQTAPLIMNMIYGSDVTLDNYKQKLKEIFTWAKTSEAMKFVEAYGARINNGEMVKNPVINKYILIAGKDRIRANEFTMINEMMQKGGEYAELVKLFAVAKARKNFGTLTNLIVASKTPKTAAELYYWIKQLQTITQNATYGIYRIDPAVFPSYYKVGSDIEMADRVKDEKAKLLSEVYKFDGDYAGNDMVKTAQQYIDALLKQVNETIFHIWNPGRAFGDFAIRESMKEFTAKVNLAAMRMAGFKLLPRNRVAPKNRAGQMLTPKIEEMRNKYPNNAFMSMIQVFKNRITLAVEIQNDDISTQKMHDARVAFDLMEEDDQAFLAEYLYIVHGNMLGTFGGSYGSLMGYEFRKKIGAVSWKEAAVESGFIDLGNKGEVSYDEEGNPYVQYGDTPIDIRDKPYEAIAQGSTVTVRQADEVTLMDGIVMNDDQDGVSVKYPDNDVAVLVPKESIVKVTVPPSQEESYLEEVQPPDNFNIRPTESTDGEIIDPQVMEFLNTQKRAALNNLADGLDKVNSFQMTFRASTTDPRQSAKVTFTQTDDFSDDLNSSQWKVTEVDGNSAIKVGANYVDSTHLASFLSQFGDQRDDTLVAIDPKIRDSWHAFVSNMQDLAKRERMAKTAGEKSQMMRSYNAVAAYIGVDLSTPRQNTASVLEQTSTTIKRLMGVNDPRAIFLDMVLSRADISLPIMSASLVEKYRDAKNVEHDDVSAYAAGSSIKLLRGTFKSNPRWAAEVVVHELLHTFTVNRIQHDAAFLKRMEDILSIAKVEAAKRPLLRDYGLTNVHELISEAFANREFRQFLAEIKVTGTLEDKSQNLWEQFKAAIREFVVAYVMGKNAPVTLLDVIVNETLETIEQDAEYNRNPFGVMDSNVEEMGQPIEQNSIRTVSGAFNSEASEMFPVNRAAHGKYMEDNSKWIKALQKLIDAKDRDGALKMINLKGWQGNHNLAIRSKLMALVNEMVPREQAVPWYMEQDTVRAVDSLKEDSQLLAGKYGLHQLYVQEVEEVKAQHAEAMLAVAENTNVLSGILKRHKAEKIRVKVLERMTRLLDDPSFTDVDKTLDLIMADEEMATIMKKIRSVYDKLRNRNNELMEGLKGPEYIKYVTDYINRVYVRKKKMTATEIKNLESKHVNQRRFPTIADALREGYELAITDPFELMKVYTANVTSLATKKLMLEKAFLIQETDGDPSVVPVYANAPIKRPEMNTTTKILRQVHDNIENEDGASSRITFSSMLKNIKDFVTKNKQGTKYVQMDSPFSEWDSFYVHPDTVKMMESVLGVRYDGKFVKALSHFNAWTKFATIGLSAFHPIAIWENIMANLRLDAFSRQGARIRYAWKSPEFQKMLKDPAFLRDALTHGVETQPYPNLEIGQIEKDLDRWQTIMNGRGFKPGVLAIKGLKKYKSWMDRHLWEKFNSESKIYAWHYLVQQRIKQLNDQGKSYDVDVLKQQAAEAINVAFGGMNWNRIMWATPKVKQMMQMLMFAPDWTASNVAVALAGLGGIKGMPTFGMSNETIRYAVKVAWPGMFVFMFMWPNFLQAMIYAAFKGNPDDDDKIFAWENEKDKGFSIDTTPMFRALGWTNPDNPKERFYMKFAKQAWEVKEMIEDPLKSAKGKSSMLVKTALEQITGEDMIGRDAPFKDEPFWFGMVSSEEGFFGSRAGRVATKFMPMTVMAYLNDQPPSWIAPTSKGMTHGKTVRAMTEVLETYAAPHLWDKIVGTPGYERKLDNLVVEIVEAAKLNGVNVKDSLKEARSAVMGQYYEQFWRALNKGDQAKLEEAAGAVVRLGGSTSHFIQSMKGKNKRLGQPAITKEEQYSAVTRYFAEANRRITPQEKHNWFMNNVVKPSRTP